MQKPYSVDNEYASKPNFLTGNKAAAADADELMLHLRMLIPTKGVSV